MAEAEALVPKQELPEHICLTDHPQLKRLAWQIHGLDELSPREALNLYERNWRQLDSAALSRDEVALIDAISRELGGGRLLV